MFGTLTLISALASVVLAQSSASSAAPGSSTPNPLIPSSVSTACATFLSNLNTDSTLKTCLTSLSSATSPFSPGNSATATKSTVTSALSSLCSDSVSSACPETYIRTKITDFWSHCTDELTKKNVDVIKLYDTIYAIIPMRTSVCAKDDSGTYCVLASPGLGSSNISPTMSSYHDNNVPFLLYNPDLDANTLCTSCVRQVLTAYMTHESNVAYGPGLSNSQLLDKQPALYEAVKTKCPAGFLGGAVQAAGGLSGGTLSSSAFATAVPQRTTMSALLVGLAGLAMSFIF